MKGFWGDRWGHHAGQWVVESRKAGSGGSASYLSPFPPVCFKEQFSEPGDSSRLQDQGAAGRPQLELNPTNDNHCSCNDTFNNSAHQRPNGSLCILNIQEVIYYWFLISYREAKDKAKDQAHSVLILGSLCKEKQDFPSLSQWNTDFKGQRWCDGVGGGTPRARIWFHGWALFLSRCAPCWEGGEVANTATAYFIHVFVLPSGHFCYLGYIY